MKLRRLILMGSGEEFGLVTGRFDDHRNLCNTRLPVTSKMERCSGKDFPQTFCSQVDYSKERPHVPGCFALAAPQVLITELRPSRF
jgi:hypothetical protein